MFSVVKYIKRNPLKKLLIDNHADFSNSASNILSLYILHKIIWRYIANYAEPYTSKFYGVLPARVDFLINIYKLPNNKCELLIMGADDDKVFMARNSDIRQQIRNELGIGENDFLIITGGKIDIDKKQTINLLRAINELNIPNLKLLLFGSIIDELKKEIYQFVDNKRIHYIGWINSEDVYNYFVASELAIFPGRHSVLWEQAVGTGIPCIFKYWIGTTHVDVGGNCKFLYSDQVEEIKTILREIFFDKEIYNGMKKVAEEAGIKKFSYCEISKKSIE
jgi:glycosyltransferase involved in cell wall biosynthesis